MTIQNKLHGVHKRLSLFRRLIPLKSFSRDEILKSYYINLHYFLFRVSDHAKRIVYDHNGIPMFRYDPPLGIRYSPTVCSYGIST